MPFSTSVYQYWPNRVGYIRFLLLFGGMLFAREAPKVASLLLLLNLLFDAVDGFLARKFGQVSKFGAVLDYTIDRLSFVGYAILLSVQFPDWLLLWAFLVYLDLLSHFFHLKASSERLSHKDIRLEEPLWLRLYYKKMILGFSCLCHDLFFIALYFSNFYPSSYVLALLFFCLPGVLFKTVAHVVQLVRAARRLVA